ncbi:MAG TPA: hypothetical protein PKH94_09715, partial [Bacteroidales bacterium]|nr:hypothetical protein [Bacteroidales bacterium]
GGSRVEIKGVAHTKWIPELTHNECFRQWSLLHIRELLSQRVRKPAEWKITHKVIPYHTFNFRYKPIKTAVNGKNRIIAINLQGFEGILSHFTQPGKMFADEISDRLKVIACIEKPHMCHSEEFTATLPYKNWDSLRKLLKAKDSDAQLLIWGPEADMATALETVEERCKMALEGVPNETRKSFENGTTIFERVLPGADRMYPDTDSAPIPLDDDFIEHAGKELPPDIMDRYRQLREWQVPEDTYTYIFSRNRYPDIERIVKELDYNPRLIGTFFGHHLKFVEGHYKKSSEFTYGKVFDLFQYIREHQLDVRIAGDMLPVIFEHPKMDLDSVLTSIKFRRVERDEILSKVDFLIEKFKKVGRSRQPDVAVRWIMGELRGLATGNIELGELKNAIERKLEIAD